MRHLLLALAATFFIVPMTACQHTVTGALDTDQYEQCVNDPESCGKQPETVAFAVIADYTRAKHVAVAFARKPSTSADEVQAIVDITGEADAEIKALVADMQANRDAGTYLRVASVVRNATTRLAARGFIDAAMGSPGGAEPNLFNLLKNR